MTAEERLDKVEKDCLHIPGACRKCLVAGIAGAEREAEAAVWRKWNPYIQHLPFCQGREEGGCECGLTDERRRMEADDE